MKIKKLEQKLKEENPRYSVDYCEDNQTFTIYYKLDPGDLLANAKAQSEDKNSEVMGFADMGFNAAVQASKMSSIYGGYFEENI